MTPSRADCFSSGGHTTLRAQAPVVDDDAVPGAGDDGKLCRGCPPRQGCAHRAAVERTGESQRAEFCSKRRRPDLRQSWMLQPYESITRRDSPNVETEVDAIGLPQAGRLKSVNAGVSCDRFRSSAIFSHHHSPFLSDTSQSRPLRSDDDLCSFFTRGAETSSGTRWITSKVASGWEHGASS